MRTLVLDSQAISDLARAKDGALPSVVLSALKAALLADSDVFVPAAVLAEQYRGGRHDQLVDSCLSRWTSIQVADTDRSLARRVGNLLGRHGLGSEHHVDATVVATALAAGGGLILTSDLRDLERLADGAVGVLVKAV